MYSLKKNFIFLILIALFVLHFFLTGCKKQNKSVSTTGAGRQYRHDLALRYAPYHYQDVDATGQQSCDGKSDYITAVNYDGNWKTKDNWENVSKKDLYANVYYSVVETETHYYIIYMFYHPRDWAHTLIDNSKLCHENDSEGLMAIIKKPDTFQAMVTLAHYWFFSYKPSGSTLQFYKIDSNYRTGTVVLEDGTHPVTGQQARGHGLKARGDGSTYDIDGDGIVYYPGTRAEIPENNNDRDVKYKLVDIFGSGGLWSRKSNKDTFYKLGFFTGNNGKGHATAPWRWDGDDDSCEQGVIAFHPAKLASIYYKNEFFSYHYLHNSYLGINNNSNKEYISNLTVSSTNDPPHPEIKGLPPINDNWTYLPTELNDDSGGNYIYVGYKRTNNRDDAVTDIKFLAYDNVLTSNPLGSDWKWINKNLNEGAGGKKIYMFWKKGGSGKPITDLVIYLQYGNNIPRQINGWYSLQQDLNQGAGGYNIFAYYKREPAKSTISITDYETYPGYIQRGGDINRYDNVKLYFRWDGNIAPTITVTNSGDYQDLYKDEKHNTTPYNRAALSARHGSRTIDLNYIIPRESNAYNQYMKIWINQLRNANDDINIDFYKPYSLSYGILHNSERESILNSVSELRLIDSQNYNGQKIYGVYEDYNGESDVSYEEPLHQIIDPEIIDNYWNRRVNVFGKGFEYQGSSPGSIVMIINSYHLGYIVKKLDCYFYDKWLFGEIFRKGKMATKKGNRELESTEIDISGDHPFTVTNGFTQRDYRDDITKELSYTVEDSAGQKTEGKIKFYAKSLFIVPRFQIALPAPRDYPEINILIKKIFKEEIHTVFHTDNDIIRILEDNSEEIRLEKYIEELSLTLTKQLDMEKIASEYLGKKINIDRHLISEYQKNVINAKNLLDYINITEQFNHGLKYHQLKSAAELYVNARVNEMIENGEIDVYIKDFKIK